ncbi:MAG: ATP-binding protein [Thermoplasmata archaeon]|nr:ATP-binding protein [Thermoplasmata archaeon]
MARPNGRRVRARRPPPAVEEGLETGVRFLTELLDKISEGVVVVDTKGEFLLINRAARMLQSPTAAPQAATLGLATGSYGIFKPDRVTPISDAESALALAMGGRTVRGMEMFFRTPGVSGGRYIISDADPLFSLRGRQIGAVANFRDITESTFNLQQLRLLERVKGVILPHPDLRSGLRQLSEEILEGIGWPMAEIWETDDRRKTVRLSEVLTTKAWPWSDPTGIRRWTRESRKLVFPIEGGSLPSRALAGGVPLWIPDLPLSVSIARRKLTREMGLGSAVLVPVPTVGGREAVLIFYHMERLPPDEALLATLRTVSELIRDYADRRLSLEELRRARSDAEGANRVKSAFLAHISHEIRTPLTAVIGMSDVLAESGLTPEQEEYVRTIRNGGKTLLAVINDLLDFAKIEAGRISIERRPFDLNQVIEEALALTGVRAAERGIELEYALPTDVPAALDSDPVRLQQILTNFLGNAIKFTEKGSVELTVGVRPAPGGAQEITFAVRDTGIGIPPDRLPELFHDFSRIDDASPRRYEGSGLGLAISKGLSEALGGHVRAESSPGHGSTFHASILAKSVEFESAEERSTRIPTARRRRVLLVGVSPFLQAGLVPWLRRWGFGPVESRANGTLRARDRRHFDVVLWDADRTGATESSLHDAIRSDSPFPSPVLALQWGRHGSEPHHVGTARTVRQLRKPLLLSSLRQALLLPEGGVELPALVPPARRDLPRAPKAASSLRVLVVDDHPVNRSVMDRMLAQLHVTADVAVDGVEAVNAARRVPYDLIFMDVEMPKLNGLEATRRIRTFEGGLRHAWIAALSAHSSDADRESAIAAGMDDFVSKPVRLDELREALQRVARPPAREEPMATAPGPALVLDTTRLLGLAEMNGRTDRRFLRRLFSTFRTESNRHLQLLERASSAGQADRFRLAAHALKSASGEVGAGRLRELAAQMEQAGQDAGPGRLAWPAARRTIAAARRELRRVELAWPRPTR